MTIIRAAISVDNNTKEEISRQAVKLFNNVLNNNPNAEIKALFASQTSDLNSYNCCTAIRETFHADFALECFQEAQILNQKEKIIRFTLFCDNDFIPNYVYMEKASDLRKDLAIRSETSN